MPNNGLHNPNGKATVITPQHPMTKRETMATEVLSALITGHGRFLKEDEPVIILRALRITDGLIEAMDEGVGMKTPKDLTEEQLANLMDTAIRSEYDESELDALIEAYGIEPDGDGSEIFTEVASRLREIDVLKKRNRELEDAIVSINEYWNGSNSQESMSHALDYIVGLTGELMQGGAT